MEILIYRFIYFLLEWLSGISKIDSYTGIKKENADS